MRQIFGRDQSKTVASHRARVEIKTANAPTANFYVPLARSITKNIVSPSEALVSALWNCPENAKRPAALKRRNYFQTKSASFVRHPSLQKSIHGASSAQRAEVVPLLNG